MKICRMCGATYDDKVDFCFQDGTPLVAAEAAAEPPPESPPPVPDVLDAPEPPALHGRRFSRRSVEDMLDVPEPRFEPAARPLDEGPERLEPPVARGIPELASAEPEFDLADPDKTLDEGTYDSPMDDTALDAPEPLAPLDTNPDSLPPPPDDDGEERTLVDAPVDAFGPVDTVDPLAEPDTSEITLEEPLPPQESVLDEDEETVLLAEAVAPEPTDLVGLGDDADGAFADDAGFDDEAGFDDDEPAKRRGLGLWIGLGGLLILFVGAALAVVMTIQKGADELGELATSAPSEVTAPAPPVAPAVTPAPVPSAADDAVADDATTDDATTDDATTDDATTDDPVAEAAPEPKPATAAPSRPAPSRPAPSRPAPSRPTPSRPAAVAPAPAPSEPEADPWGAASAPSSQGTISVRSTPSGAQVMIDGTSVGKAPVSHDVPFGMHTVKVEMSGYKADVRTIDVATPQLSVPFELRPLVVTGQVNIFGMTGATVYVDGSPVGRIPTTAQLSEGRHSFKVVGEDGTTFEQSRDVQFEVAGRPVTISLKP